MRTFISPTLALTLSILGGCVQSAPPIIIEINPPAITPTTDTDESPSALDTDVAAEPVTLYFEVSWSYGRPYNRQLTPGQKDVPIVDIRLYVSGDSPKTVSRLSLPLFGDDTGSGQFFRGDWATYFKNCRLTSWDGTPDSTNFEINAGPVDQIGNHITFDDELIIPPGWGSAFAVPCDLIDGPFPTVPIEFALEVPTGAEIVHDADDYKIGDYNLDLGNGSPSWSVILPQPAL